MAEFFSSKKTKINWKIYRWNFTLAILDSIFLCQQAMSEGGNSTPAVSASASNSASFMQNGHENFQEKTVRMCQQSREGHFSDMLFHT